TDAILYGSQASWSDLVRRPAQRQPTATFPVAMLCLALMFPTYFVLANNLGRAQTIPMDQRLLIGNGISAIVLGGIPFFLGMFNRLQWRTAAGIQHAGPLALLGAALLGLALWPAAQEVFLLSEWLGLSGLSKQQLADARAILEKLPDVSLPMILATMAIVP